MKRNIRYFLVALTVVASLFFNSMLSYAAHEHQYVLYSRTLSYVYTIPCVTPGCTVTVYCYHDVYRCSGCGDTFYQDIEDRNHHSMNHPH